MDFLVAAQRPAEDRKASAQKAADTRAERYGDEVLFVAAVLSTSEIFVLASMLTTLRAPADPLRQEVKGGHLH